jgi:aminoglycoside 6'-N-acetyltransferase I
MTTTNSPLIRRCALDQIDAWVSLRLALWPSEDKADLRRNACALLARSDDAVAFLALADGAAIGFAEATLRHDNVNGCETSPAGFLEGLYVRETHRRQGIARRLCAEVERWASARGCRELGSDTYLDYLESQRMHAALGFEEMERVVCYRKRLL